MRVFTASSCFKFDSEKLHIVRYREMRIPNDSSSRIQKLELALRHGISVESSPEIYLSL